MISIVINKTILDYFLEFIPFLAVFCYNHSSNLLLLLSFIVDKELTDILLVSEVIVVGEVIKVFKEVYNILLIKSRSMLRGRQGHR